MQAKTFCQALKFAEAATPPGAKGYYKEWQRAVLIEFQDPNIVFIVGTNGERLHYLEAESAHFCGNTRFVARPKQKMPDDGELMFLTDGANLQIYRNGQALPFDCEPCAEYGDWRKVGFHGQRPPHSVAEGWADLGYMMGAAVALEPFVPRDAEGKRAAFRCEAHINPHRGIVWKLTTGLRPPGGGFVEAAAIITGRVAE